MGSSLAVTHLGWKEGAEWDGAFQHFTGGWGDLMLGFERCFGKGPLDQGDSNNEGTISLRMGASGSIGGVMAKLVYEMSDAQTARYMKLTGKPGTGKTYAGFDEAGAGNGLWEYRASPGPYP